PSLPMKVPLEEFLRAVERVPHMIEPLAVTTKSPRRIVLSATEETRKSSMAPPMVEIDRDSLYESPDLSHAPVPVIAPVAPSNQALPVSKSTPRMEAVSASSRPKIPQRPQIVAKAAAPAAKAVIRPVAAPAAGAKSAPPPKAKSN